MKRQLIFLLAFQLLQCFIFSLVKGQQPYFSHLTVRDGLPGQTVYEVRQDRAGFIWMATENGLFRYDGHHSRTWTQKDGLPDNEVLSLMEDDQGRIWVATSRGCVFLKDGVINGRKSAPWIPKLAGLPLSLVQLDNGKVCISSRYGVLSFDEKEVDTLLWGDNSGDYRFVYDRGELPSLPISFWGDTFGNTVESLQGPKGRTSLPQCWDKMVAGSFGGKAREKDMKRLVQDSAYLDDIHNRLQTYCGGCDILKLYQEADSTLWAATSGNGVLIYNEKNGEILQILNQATIHGISTDLGGNKWIYSMNEGVYILPQGHLEVLSY
ncbi:MAG TPA: hypothetical protein ENJ82_03955, partial [Bacteroidetes bacterium]|nr:hypothetical protein [Bacteroidota bacterium]